MIDFEKYKPLNTVERIDLLVSVSTMTYCVVQINCLPLPRFFKEVTMKTAEERYEETWNSYLELLNKDPRATRIQLASANLQHFFVKALSWC